MERYEAYKDSRAEWLGEIPVGWEVKRFRYAFDLITDKAGDNLLKIGLENIESESGKLISTDTEFEGDGIHFLSGDILFGKLRPYLAKVYLADFRGKAVGDFFVFRSKGEIKDQFGAKLILSKRFIDVTNSSTYGSKMPRVSWDFISELLIAYPNIDEQAAIANFLDRKTAEIDALIAQKERLLELYEEEKTAIINHAVTKGLDPNAELKDSGVEWLGEIPVGWDIRKLKYGVSKVGSGVTPSGGASTYQLSGIPLLRSQNIHVDGIKMDDVAYIDEKLHHSMRNSKVQAGDVLLNITGASIGRCFYVDENLGEANVNQHVCIIRPNDKINTSYLYFIICSDLGQVQINIEQTGSGREGLNFEALKNFVIPYFSVEEQTAIVNFLDRKITEINAKISKTQRIIELQKEYRTALISEMVTGKIKVPELPTQEASA